MDESIQQVFTESVFHAFHHASHGKGSKWKCYLQGVFTKDRRHTHKTMKNRISSLFEAKSIIAKLLIGVMEVGMDKEQLES